METHSHPESNATIAAIAVLQPGAVLTEHDRYPSRDGTWSACPCPTLVLNTTHIRWVRTDLSEEARELLRLLAQDKTGWYCHLGRFDHSWALVPYAGYDSFTATMPMATPQVRYNDLIVKELIDVGFLSNTGGTYSLTEAGRDYAMQH